MLVVRIAPHAEYGTEEWGTSFATVLPWRNVKGQVSRRLISTSSRGPARCRISSQEVRLNRTNPPDAILREVYERTGDRPFAHISDVITDAELTAILDHYRTVAGYSRMRLRHS